MNINRFAILSGCIVIGSLICGCDDSKAPLSDLKTAQADERLYGLWKVRQNNDAVEYYHVGHVPDAPSGLMRVIGVSHPKSGQLDPEDFLAFITKLGDKTYLNVMAGGRDNIKRLKDNDWSLADESLFFLFKYDVDGDTVTIAGMDNDAKKAAIEAGKIKGEVGAQSSKFTDTTENLARFVESAGNSLFDSTPGQLDRVK